MGSCCCCCRKGSQSEPASPNPYGPPLGAVTDSNKVSPGSSVTPPRPPGAEAAGGGEEGEEEREREREEREGPPGGQTAGDDEVVVLVHTAGDDVVLLRMPYQLPSDATKTLHEDELFSLSVVCSSTTVDGEEPNLAESTWPDVSLPTASMRIDPSTHMHACTTSEFDSDDDFSPADHSFSFTDSRRVPFLTREWDRAALREIAASEAAERRIIVDFFDVVRWSIAIKRCKGLLVIERRVLLMDFFRERAALLLSAMEAQEFVGRRAIELQWHSLLPHRSKRRSTNIGTAEVTEPVEVIGTAEVMEPVEVIGTAEVTEPVEVIGTAEVMEPVEVIGTAEVTEPVEVIGTAEVAEPVEVIGTVEVMEPVVAVRGVGFAEAVGPVRVPRAVQRPATAPVSHFRALREPAAAEDCVLLLPRGLPSSSSTHYLLHSGPSLWPSITDTEDMEEVLHEESVERFCVDHEEIIEWNNFAVKKSGNS